MKIVAITRGALAIALIYVSFLLFRGPTNILNALVAPLTLFLLTINTSVKDNLTIYGIVILFCFFFINMQTFFIIFYCIIAIVLAFIHKNNYGMIKSIVLLSVVVSISFWSGILLTDLFFHTQINNIMLKVFDGNYIVYLSMIGIEAAIVSITLFTLSKGVIKRTTSARNNSII